ncbi:MAG TPA: MqnA/MqnD/SBP family protein, partial [Candidatus Acidoferrum sp.]|nr:MqnA/MqnD/SBP family protein [Candidatus Acidoferrum sp.]
SLVRKSIQFGLDHREDALDYAMQFARDMDRALVDRFVGMYVNDLTLDYGERGRAAVRRLLALGYERGLIPHRVEPQFTD